MVSHWSAPHWCALLSLKVQGDPQDQFGAADKRSTLSTATTWLNHVWHFMPTKQGLIWVLQGIIRHLLEHGLSILWDLVEQLSWEDDPDIIFVAAEVNFDDQHVQSNLPPCLLAQELEPEPLPRRPTRRELIEDAWHRAQAWADWTYGPNSQCWH